MHLIFDFFDLLAQLSGKKYKLIKFPVGAMMFSGKVIQLYSKLTGKAPLLTPPWIRKYYYNWDVDSSKAQREIGYSFISLEDGLKKTIDWLNNNPQ